MNSSQNVDGKTIGILGLQGCITPHFQHLEALGATPKLVKYPKDLENISALILPGGESTTQLKLLQKNEMMDALIQKSKDIPFWGICAGAILMAKHITPHQPSLGIMDISIHRNAYGRQVDSFMDAVCGQDVAFIRAPIIQKVSSTLTIKTKHQNHPTWVIGENHMVTTFHPELSTSTPSVVHEYFIQHVQSAFDKTEKSDTGR
ncbi:MAG: hypothetical protein A3B70_00705 [Deltaproteobacteria bacterium RIFCSPHIGHO2_02_FULL_40_11]|nr:MAG: hypothetical protein A3B70_00705 [Deltaproteobacteria bacterium RIFCSPHIGHO2_02_FULL_40_11]